MSLNLAALSVDARSEYESFMRQFPTHSDLNFTSAFVWDIYATNSYKILADKKSLLFSLGDYHTGERLYCVISHLNPEERIRETLLVMQEAGIKDPAVSLIPDYMIQQFRTSDDLIVEEDRDNFDYLISVRKMAQLHPREFKAKSYLAKKFAKERVSETRLLGLTEGRTQEQVLMCFARWCAVRKKSGKDVEDERAALDRMLEHAGKLNVQCFGLFVGGIMVSFIIFEVEHNQNVGIFHFEKTDLTYVGASEYIKKQLAKYLLSVGVELINYEQDLGLDGLRQAKTLYHPIGYRKKYTVRMRTTV